MNKKVQPLREHPGLVEVDARTDSPDFIVGVPFTGPQHGAYAERSALLERTLLSVLLGTRLPQEIVLAVPSIFSNQALDAAAYFPASVMALANFRNVDFRLVTAWRPGVVAARAALIRYARQERQYLVLMDDDVLVEGNTLEYLTKRPEVDGVQPAFVQGVKVDLQNTRGYLDWSCDSTESLPFWPGTRLVHTHTPLVRDQDEDEALSEDRQYHAPCFALDTGLCALDPSSLTTSDWYAEESFPDDANVLGGSDTLLGFKLMTRLNTAGLLLPLAFGWHQASRSYFSNPGRWGDQAKPKQQFLRETLAQLTGSGPYPGSVEKLFAALAMTQAFGDHAAENLAECAHAAWRAMGDAAECAVCDAPCEAGGLTEHHPLCPFWSCLEANPLPAVCA